MLRRGAAKLVVLLTFLVGGALGARDGLTGLLAGYAGGARRHRPDGLGLRERSRAAAAQQLVAVRFHSQFFFKKRMNIYMKY